MNHQAISPRQRVTRSALMLLASVAGLFGVASAAHAACAPTLDHEVRLLNQRSSVNLCERFQGQVLLVVNTASRCGYTPQYKGLETLWQTYGEEGLVVLGFPSNDFGSQEPGSEAEIKNFCELDYGVSFPMFEKVGVRYGGAHPFFQALAEATGQSPGWNFHKYVVNREGKVVASFPSHVTPDDQHLISTIKRELTAEGRDS